MRETTNICVHGKWNGENETCTCEAGWISDTQQDALAPFFIWCNFTDPFVRYPPERGLSGKAISSLGSRLPVWSLAVLVLIPIVVIIIACFCCCCRRCFKPSAAAQPTLQQQQGMVNMPVQSPQLTFGSVLDAPMYVMPAPMYPDATRHLPVVSPHHYTFAGLGPAYFYEDPYAVQFKQPTESQHATGNWQPLMGQQELVPEKADSDGASGVDRSSFASMSFPLAAERPLQGSSVLSVRNE
ncbi:adenylate kinase [Trypanosoma rangeli]|uniref:Adenylate kinase n=1 Tax=Trypanosoma rangeli TaxID=5698 RepID=A0A3R7KWJ7_TRYRA|nr:adenylate kinase [Trypanosoma rangeli]RNF11096.1 adenylate kinase [Trypanosoma rangeli]|eukprot:RNF11096.1 adenylate kinase [Trypanosoma rangeli]